MNLPSIIIERARKYREQEKGDYDSWCDGDKINEGHFQALEVRSILTDGVEVKLCRDCRRSIRMDSFDDYGHLKNHITNELTYSELKHVISKKITEIKQLIEVKEKGLSDLRNYLSCLEHSDRTIWLLYPNKEVE